MSYQIPFDSNGNMVSYPAYKGTMKDNYEFTDTLQLIAMHRGRSACDFEFKGTNGTTYSMFYGEFSKLIQKFNKGELSNLGYIRGTWAFRKQGANYSITLKDGGSNV